MVGREGEVVRMARHNSDTHCMALVSGLASMQTTCRRFSITSRRRACSVVIHHQ